MAIGSPIVCDYHFTFARKFLPDFPCICLKSYVTFKNFIFLSPPFVLTIIPTNVTCVKFVLWGKGARVCRLRWEGGWIMKSQLVLSFATISCRVDEP